MERFLRFFAERHLLVHVMVAVIVVSGYVSATRASRETFPNITVPTLFVTAHLPGASARDIETKVSIPIEDVVAELDGVKTYSTVVTDNTSLTTIELYDDFGTARIRQAERDLAVLIDGIGDFPPEMEDEPVIEVMNPRRFPVLQIALAGPSRAVLEAGRRLERKLPRLSSVSRVAMIGLPDPEVRIFVDPARAREHGVTLLDVLRSVQRRNVSSTGGSLETPDDRRQVVLWSRYEQPEDVADTLIRFAPDSGALRVRDVARIELGREDVGLLAHTNGLPGLSVIVFKREDSDIIDTVDAVRAELEQTTLPDGVSAVLVRDESFMARNRLALMFNNGILGAVLVAAVLFVFLTPTAAGWVLAGIPIVFLGSLTLLQALGLSINMVTLTGFVVVLGMVVDDAIVVSERIVTKRQAGMPRAEAAVMGATEMARPVLASAITTILAFLPLWAMGGMTGKMIFALPTVVILALVLSVIESFLILPAHLSIGGGSAEAPKRPFMLRLEKQYRALLEWTLAHRALVFATFAATLVFVFGVVAPRVPVMLFPQDDSEAAFLKVTMPLGTPIERTEAAVGAIERQLPGIIGEDLAAVTARIGHQESERQERERGAAENEAVITALFRNTGRDRTSAEWIAILEERVAVPVDANVVYQAEIMGPPIGQPVTVHVASNQDETRRAAAAEIADWLGGTEGVVNVEVDERPGTPQIELNLDYAKLALRGLDAEDVGLTLRAAFHGLVASELRDLDDTTRFRVLFDPSARRSLDALLETPVRSRSGELVRLRDVVHPLEVPAVSRIYHRDGVRTATVRAQFAAGSAHTALDMATRLEAVLLPRYDDVAGLEVFNGGEAVETRDTTADVGLVAMLAFGGIGLVIALMLGSFLEAFFVIAVIPFAVAGVIVTFALHGQPLSIFAMMGTVGLSGVVVNASIVMVDAIHRRLGGAESLRDEGAQAALIDAVVSRLRPILVTSLTTLGGVIPTAYGIGGHDAIVAPMSLAIGWGLMFSTLITLFLVPTLYTVARDLRTLRVGDLVERITSRDRGPRQAEPAG